MGKGSSWGEGLREAYEEREAEERGYELKLKQLGVKKTHPEYKKVLDEPDWRRPKAFKALIARFEPPPPAAKLEAAETEAMKKALEADLARVEKTHSQE